MSPAHKPSERRFLNPFVVQSDEPGAPPPDQRDLMSQPFFSLAKGCRMEPIQYEAGDLQVEIHGFPGHGIATIWDSDVLIWAASQLVDAADRGQETSRFLRFTPYQFLTATRRGTGLSQYLQLRNSLQRLQSTVVMTTIRHGRFWRRQQFSWINEWGEVTDAQGQCRGMEFVLPQWFYQGVLDRSLVLSIDPEYFDLTGGIERWLYRLARRHAGRQANGWAFDLRHLHLKSGSLSRFSDFASDLRRIVAKGPLLGYRLSFEQEGAQTLLRIRPPRKKPAISKTVDKPVDNPVDSSSTIGISGASTIGISGAKLSAYQAHGSGPSDCFETPIRDSNFLTKESNLKRLVGGAVSPLVLPKARDRR